MKKHVCIILPVIILLLFSTASYAYIPYSGYTYDGFARAVPSAVGYEPTRTVYKDASGTVFFKSIEDISIDKEGNIYLLDSESGRIIKMDQEYRILWILDKFATSDGIPYTLNKPQGFFIAGDTIYIADTDNSKILVLDQTGKIRKEITKPKSEIFPQEKDFKPQNVLADSVGNIYTIISGVFQGAATFDKEGEFIEFYGSNRVELTANLLSDFIWKKFVTDSMRDRMNRYVPLEYINFDVDKDNFIYTCTARVSNSLGELRKINPVGNNIWNMDNFGDLEVNYSKGSVVDTSFKDVEVDEKGFLFALDEARKRIFMYDQDGEAVLIFGAKGNQMGTFQTPSLIESFHEKVYVYDSTKFNITEFKPTEYGKKVVEAIQMYQDGKYIESKSLWEDVLKRNSNNYQAYVGIGKALFQTGNYKEAMEYYKLGGSKQQETLAFGEFRTKYIREHFSLFAGIIVVLALGGILVINRKKLRIALTKRGMIR